MNSCQLLKMKISKRTQPTPYKKKYLDHRIYFGRIQLGHEEQLRYISIGRLNIIKSKISNTTSTTHLVPFHVDSLHAYF
jgi:hypothetical protein